MSDPQIRTPHTYGALKSELDALGEITPEELAVQSLPPEVLEYLMDEMDRLAEVMTDGGFHIDSVEKLDWFANKLANMDAEYSRVEHAMKTRLAQIKKARAAFYEQYKIEAQAFTLKMLADNPSKKSFTLTCGVKIGFRKSQRKIEFNEGFEPVPGNLIFEKIRKFVEENVEILPELADAVRTKYEVLKTPLNIWWKGDKLHEAIGEIPPGMHLIPETDEWYVQAPKE